MAAANIRRDAIPAEMLAQRSGMHGVYSGTPPRRRPAPVTDSRPRLPRRSIPATGHGSGLY
jgi:hypothetical protein